MVPLPAAAGTVGTADTADSTTLNELVLAVREYGQHLQSHTAIVQAMAEASKQLSSVAARLEAGVLLAGPPSDPLARVGAHTHPTVTRRCCDPSDHARRPATDAATLDVPHGAASRRGHR